jgi:mono/diheme cytochrome c family protein
MTKTVLGAALITGLVAAGLALSADLVVAQEVKKDYTVSQEAWAGGMRSGEGNFLQNCMPCHGVEGGGDGPLAESLGGDIRPRNLSDAALLSTRTDEFLLEVIKYGGKHSGFSELMPDWGETFDDEAIGNIVKYVRTSLCKCKYEGGGGD